MNIDLSFIFLMGIRTTNSLEAIIKNATKYVFANIF